jgi:hypothetical protein
MIAERDIHVKKHQELQGASHKDARGNGNPHGAKGREKGPKGQGIDLMSKTSDYPPARVWDKRRSFVTQRGIPPQKKE